MQDVHTLSVVQELHHKIVIYSITRRQSFGKMNRLLISKKGSDREASQTPN